VIDTLKAAFMQGRIDKDDFDLRVGQTFAARTYAQLAVITADLRSTSACPRAAINSNDRHQQQLANMKLASAIQR
jgi:hypothetical protein